MESENGFVKLPIKLLYDERISEKAKLLYAILIDLADENGCAEVSIHQLQWLLKCKSDKTVRTAESELYKAGYIQISRTGRASYIWIAHEYQTYNRWSALEWYEKERRKAK